jgi:hypothetical protein
MIVFNVDINVDYASNLSINQFEREFRGVFGKVTIQAYNEILKYKKDDPINDNIKIESNERVIESKKNISKKGSPRLYNQIK